MATYAIGDIQGCYDSLRRLLEKLNFNPENDYLWLTGDLVNRGEQSLKTLRFLKDIDQSIITVLGNHDLHLLALHFEVTDLNENSYLLKEVLDAPDRESLMQWLRFKPLTHFDKKKNRLLVHAGISPDWSIEESLQYSQEVELLLRSDRCADLLKNMYKNTPKFWSENLDGYARYRFIINTLTRMRAINNKNGLELEHKGKITKNNKNLNPWFKPKKHRWKQTSIIFGHWSALGLMVQPQFICLDTGCVWGRELTAMQLDSKLKTIKVSHNTKNLI